MRTFTSLLFIILLTACGPLSEPTTISNRATPESQLPEATATVAPDAPSIEVSPSPQPTIAATATPIPVKPTPVPPTPTRIAPSPAPKPPTPTSAPQNLPPLPAKAMLNLTHEYQKWNNCGPVSLGVVATYFGIPRNQFQAADEVKGAELDKNVGVSEMKAYLEGLGLRVLTRVNGTAPQMMRLVASGFPVIVHQWLLKPNGELVGHYRVVQGYDQSAATFTTSDPYTPPKLAYSFADFERFWQPWNHRYIVAYRAEQESTLRTILSDDFDATKNVAIALQAEQTRVAANPKDPYEYFSLGDDRLTAGDVSGAIAAYDQSRALGLPDHFAWYNFGPYDALFRSGAYQRMLDLSAPVLKDASNLEEIHFWRGKALQGLGQKDKARAEFALAVQLNAHYNEAKVALAALN